MYSIRNRNSFNLLYIDYKSDVCCRSCQTVFLFLLSLLGDTQTAWSARMIQLRGSLFVFSLFSSGYWLIRLYRWHFGNFSNWLCPNKSVFCSFYVVVFMLFLWLSMVSSATFIYLILPSCDVFVTYFSITNFNFVFRRKGFGVFGSKSVIVNLSSFLETCMYIVVWLSWLNPVSSGFNMVRFKFKGGLCIQEADLWILASLGCCTTGRVL